MLEELLGQTCVRTNSQSSYFVYLFKLVRIFIRQAAMSSQRGHGHAHADGTIHYDDHSHEPTPPPRSPASAAATAASSQGSGSSVSSASVPPAVQTAPRPVPALTPGSSFLPAFQSASPFLFNSFVSSDCHFLNRATGTNASVLCFCGRSERVAQEAGRGARPWRRRQSHRAPFHLGRGIHSVLAKLQREYIGSIWKYDATLGGLTRRGRASQEASPCWFAATMCCLRSGFV